MNRSQWENRYDDELSIAFQDTSSEEYANEEEFRDAMYQQYVDNENEDMVIAMEDSKWSIRK